MADAVAREEAIAVRAPARRLVGELLALPRLLRVHQWTKNLLVVIPLLLAHKFNSASLFSGLLAAFDFSLAASAMYVLNDFIDVKADRLHPTKRNRPIASGRVSPFVAAFCGVKCAVSAFLGALVLPSGFGLDLGIYVLLTLCYTLFFKKEPILDVLVLAGLYTLRLHAGGAATGTPISNWLAGFSLFFFVSLAFVKRFAELSNLRVSGEPPRNRRGYIAADLEQMRAFGTASAYAAVVVFSLYISNSDITLLYRRPVILWAIAPLLFYWLNRVWLLAARGDMHEDPVVFALTDPASLLIGAGMAGILLLGSGLR